MRLIIASLTATLAIAGPALAHNQVPAETFEVSAPAAPAPVADTCSMRLTPTLSAALALPAGATQTC